MINGNIELNILNLILEFALIHPLKLKLKYFELNGISYYMTKMRFTG